MRASPLIPFILLVCAACAQLPSQNQNQNPAGSALQAQFLCSHGERVEMRFFPDRGVAVLLRHGTAIELQQQVAASGFIYSNGPNTVRGKGDEISIEIGRMVPLKCTALPQSSS